ncbi:putative reverse transcriptase zinc-binding domain-containing protein [Helianthus annuus]|uniref:Reverse transcriptase zinc-binding domain-containing protein n=2 Tax=Helianthus annuus TaxID=4232 RepID=A0A9K3JC28_HELAN|nr:putative reverse transcriptase zinc-binding domain-containing protein [Helianthus annuus]KAJ0606610.1 putative reverse transcriptase zinc-binding domain-containing protein [Helianthus annuus]KAJ0933943.1 putative reverse transcriptase zinc-binding domain-containing protein [Helianthus annuus]KAJ0942009.1 putative reverse transcriptase zinc-binding domain-containing protein [Helianthus annuus]
MRQVICEKSSGRVVPLGFVWNGWAHPKANYLAWRAAADCLRTKSALARRGMGLNGDLCCRCGLEAEDTNHLFIKCLVVRCIWWQLSVWMRISIPTDSHSVTERLAFFTNQLGSKRWKKWSLWLLWQLFGGFGSAEMTSFSMARRSRTTEWWRR